jgi:hypothetical protein
MLPLALDGIERGPKSRTAPGEPEGPVDLAVSSLTELAERLGA